MTRNKQLIWIWISTWVLTGCTTSKEELLPHGDQTMLDVWNVGGRGPQQQLLDARASLRRPMDSVGIQRTPELNRAYTRTAANEVYNLFARLPNPDLVMYVFPHLAGNEPTPVPGYSTVFPFYTRTQYAMPGERTEEY